MEKINKILDDLCDLLQDDLITVLDGLPENFITAVCQLVIDRTEEAKKKL